MTELEKLVAEVRNIEKRVHAKLDATNTRLDAVADIYGQPLLDSRMTGAVYAAIVLVAILFGAKVF